ncbi:hypothetical protein GCM10022198_20770 [Klugiella xanthotipulae]|uniref:Virulence-associated protein n=1 Tax=Klugiella xanthotipulae TaxID=244735 RepID=A0A543HXT4_9MICO|nr:VapA/VapB family virulence-associated protein [Klugiella xanthotipulae]TQM63164.1 virulence-associated protein [Klugiella xanthotipulae]
MKIRTNRLLAGVAGLSLALGCALATTPAQAAEPIPDTTGQSAPAAPASDHPTKEASIPAAGSIVGGLVYTRVQVDAKDGSKKSFVGNGGGLFTPGAGAVIGTLYTDDLARLYADTVSFQVNAAAAYTNVNFFDADSHLLGHLQAGSLSTVVGIGGGTGSWA